MFHPIYNANGRISIFRLVCLVIIAACMLVYGFLLLVEPNKSIDQKADRDELVQNGNNQVQEKDQDPLTEVIFELQNVASYLSSCGIINQGFEGCEIDFSKNISDKFLTFIDLAEDGYSLELKSKTTQHCSLILVMNDEFRAYDENGKFATDCLNVLDTNKAKSIAHDYETMQGQPAPSGFAPVFTQTADNIKINHTL